MIERAVALWKASSAEKVSAADVSAQLSVEFGCFISRNAVIARMHRSGFSFSGPPINSRLRRVEPVSVAGAVQTKGLVHARPADIARRISERLKTQKAAKLAGLDVPPLHARESKPPALVLKPRQATPRAPASAGRVPESLRIPLLEARPFQCRYIDADPLRTDAVTFCGHPTDTGSWCPAHRVIVYVPSATSAQTSGFALNLTHRKPTPGTRRHARG
ncbi:GcrA family cell cycle regulator [Methylobacterium sp. 37f]|uniref:GcrA family cell cycle regulator n=1 Tax=Methylobacterium sp. 37f TaxID=2817058 RepID=UPI001FFC4003|nr:GcrA family cell cycle regulator [Methylobacterium sp. 37f]MCK2055307.1 hypothetical protein [Methylobacterium sp. 37f]